MTVRHRLRRLLRMLARFLDPLSAAAIRPPAPTASIAEVEAALQVERAVKFGQGEHAVCVQRRCCCCCLVPVALSGQSQSCNGLPGGGTLPTPPRCRQPCTALAAPVTMQAPLPWELFELYRLCDGQDRERGGVQFLHEARLLSLPEALAAAQERQGPAALAKAFAALHGAGLRTADDSSGAEACRRPRCEGGSAGGAAGLPCASAGTVTAAGGSTAHAWAGREAAASAAVAEAAGEPDVLLPFSDKLRGRRRYCMDLRGRVWLSGGWHAHACAPSLADLLRRILT